MTLGWRLEQERYEHFCSLPVFPVLIAEEPDALHLIRPGGEDQEQCGNGGEQNTGPGWNLKEDAPRQKEQGAV